MFEHAIQQAREMIARFERTTEEGDETPSSIKVTNLEYDQWNDGVERLVGEAFGTNSEQVQIWKAHASPERQRELSEKIHEESRRRWGKDDWHGGSIHYLRASITLLNEFEASLKKPSSQRSPERIMLWKIVISIVLLAFALAGFIVLPSYTALLWLLFLIVAYPVALAYTAADQPMENTELVEIYKAGLKQVPIISKLVRNGPFSFDPSEPANNQTDGEEETQSRHR